MRIAVSGKTQKYDQTLTWIQNLGECTAGDRVALNAFSSSSLEVVYESSDESIAYVSEGEVVFACSGEVTLTATQPGNYKFNAAEPIAKTPTIRSRRIRKDTAAHSNSTSAKRSPRSPVRTRRPSP